MNVFNNTSPSVFPPYLVIGQGTRMACSTFSSKVSSLCGGAVGSTVYSSSVSESGVTVELSCGVLPPA